MLVLSRKVGDRIIIDKNIEVTVVQIRGNKVRLGVTAPRDVLVKRPEMHNRAQEDHPRRQIAAPSL